MRPQHDAAENGSGGAHETRERSASMRPQHDAAENAVAFSAGNLRAVAASMRPQHDAAENDAVLGNHPWNCASFNEAAA